MSTVLVTPRSLTNDPGHAQLDRLLDVGATIRYGPPGRMPSADDLSDLVPGITAWIAGIEPIDRATLHLSDQLQVIARNGVGVDSIDLDAAAERAISVVPAVGANAGGVAELVLMQVLTARRPYRTQHSITSEDAWQRAPGTELSGRVAAVVGAGAIGSQVARLLLACGMTVRVVDPFRLGPEGSEQAASVAEALVGADVVSLHCPPSDRPIVGAAEMATLATQATLVNTARAGLVDLDATLDAFTRGELGGFVTDVYDPEPPDPHPLWDRPDVWATPHIGGYTHESVDRSLSMAVDAVLAVLI